MNKSIQTQPTIIELAQGSREWLDYRLGMRNASETAAVLGVSPWMTPYQLWLLKIGRAETKVTAAMQHGTEMEATARAAYEAETGNIMQPLVLQRGRYSASLDGMTLEGDLIVEIKCPYKGQESELWKQVKAGHVPDHYAAQVQHQLMVSGARLAHLYVFDGVQGLLRPIEPIDHAAQRIQDGWDQFQVYLDTDTPPPLTEADTAVREDADWVTAAEAFANAKRAADLADQAVATARDALVALAKHPKEQGAGVSVTRFWKAGNVDYKRVPELKGVNLEKYRGRLREEVRVTTS
ncbi:MAG: YqaJ viral recombinase family protein [Rhodoferax sp.]|uniref:lambda-exonuclease family protein n=1 Tax=Rhodoferax sp. TaxID=50421 RepID=UPI001B6DDAFA|nr:YqaJ viral recombinase family protein [Rhodoferax sp.]MBP9905629.1 YqaJ viral recombinase family protein [Rhodoferax sp.]